LRWQLHRAAANGIPPKIQYTIPVEQYALVSQNTWDFSHLLEPFTS
jgi:hypothetical protein